MRLAWFSPWPPEQSGVAGRSAVLAARLAAAGHALDVFVSDHHAALPAHRVFDAAYAAAPVDGALRVRSAHDFVWREARGHYDLAVYQIGNSRWHEFIWPYAVRWPGLVLLHDARLHHARGRALLRTRRTDAYRAEFAWSEPGVSPALAELAIHGYDGAYFYQWPMTRAVVATARLVAAHARGAARELQAAWPDQPITDVALGDDPPAGDPAEARARFRRAHALDPEAIVFGVFGALTASKRVPQILRAFAATHALTPHVRLLLAGEPDPRLTLDAAIDALGLRDVVRLVRGPDDDEFDRAIAATDVSLNLRWPTALETSGPWIKSLALGRATVLTDLAHQTHLPTLDPRTWRPHAPADDGSADAVRAAIAVAIDILDEDHSLRLAMRRLSVDADLRERLGRAGRDYWAREHTVDRMVADCERAIAAAVSAPPRPMPVPGHSRPDPMTATTAWLEPFGALPADRISVLTGRPV